LIKAIQSVLETSSFIMRKSFFELEE